MGALALPLIAGAAVGALGLGVSALSRNAQNKTAGDTASILNQNSALATQLGQQQNSLLLQQQALTKQETQDRQNALSQALGSPIKNFMPGLSTINTSPLGDTTKPKTGRYTLLGN